MFHILSHLNCIPQHKDQNYMLSLTEEQQGSISLFEEYLKCIAFVPQTLTLIYPPPSWYLKLIPNRITVTYWPRPLNLLSGWVCSNVDKNKTDRCVWCQSSGLTSKEISPCQNGIMCVCFFRVINMSFFAAVGGVLNKYMTKSQNPKIKSCLAICDSHNSHHKHNLPLNLICIISLHRTGSYKK